MAGELNADMNLPERSPDQSDAMIMGRRTLDEECSGGEDDGWSDVSEEAWVAYNPADISDISDSAPLVSYELEDWDAEMAAEENPYDEDDVADVYEEQISGCQRWSEDSYEPSSHHTPPIQWSREVISGAVHMEAGQFEDADQ